MLIKKKKKKTFWDITAIQKILTFNEGNWKQIIIQDTFEWSTESCVQKNYVVTA